MAYDGVLALREGRDAFRLEQSDEHPSAKVHEHFVKGLGLEPLAWRDTRLTEDPDEELFLFLSVIHDEPGAGTADVRRFL